MDKEIARRLLPLVNDKELMDALVAYAEHRINYGKDACIIAGTLDEVRKWQGAHRELSRMVTLRDEVIEALKGG